MSRVYLASHPMTVVDRKRHPASLYRIDGIVNGWIWSCDLQVSLEQLAAKSEVTGMRISTSEFQDHSLKLLLLGDELLPRMEKFEYVLPLFCLPFSFYFLFICVAPVIVLVFKHLGEFQDRNKR